MGQDSNWDIAERVNDVFTNIVIPVFENLIRDYDQVGGYEVKIVSDGPLIMGIEKYSSIMVKHPGGMEMIICVYWVKNSERLIAENIQLITHNVSLDIFSVTKEELAAQVKFLSGLKD
ncbi:MAG: hypothetical protein WD000_03280 [Thermodesulfobacteriota bacterium]